MVKIAITLAAIAAAVTASVLPRQYSGGPYNGQATWYNTGLGACGIWNSDSDHIAAAGQALFDSYPGATGNPNTNPICGKPVLVNYNGAQVTVTITDRCVGCGEYDLDLSPAAFQAIADPGLGRIPITWWWQ